MARLSKAQRRKLRAGIPMKTVDETGARRVSVMKDPGIEYPYLYLDVFIQGEPFERAAFAPMFARAACKLVKEVKQADLVIFTGGPDVNPLLYGKPAHSKTSWDDARDKEDILVFNECIREGIPMFGVCRGMQFIHVMMGGELYQDVDKHHKPHNLYDRTTKKFLQSVSSVHHQMVIDDGDPGLEVIADSYTSDKRSLSEFSCTRGPHQDVEALFYRDICAFGVQGHPEYSGYSLYTAWTLHKLQEYICNNPDLARTSENVLRLPEQYREERQKLWVKKMTKEGLKKVNEHIKETN